MLLIDTGIFVAVADRDASIIAIAERRNVTQVATLNHRDFAVVRPAHCDTLELVP